MAASNEPNEQLLREAAYTLSRARIAEQVIINVLSALALGTLAALASLLLLLYQNLAKAIVVPTNVLTAVVFLGLGALLMLILLVGGLYIALRIVIGRSDTAALGFIFGLFGMLIGSRLATEYQKKSSSGTATDYQKKSSSGTATDYKSDKAEPPN